MPSKEVLDSLQQLHEELEKLAPAIKHVETATEVTKIAKSIPDKHIELIESVKKTDKEFKNQLFEINSKSIEEFGDENKKTLTRINSLAETISEYQDKLSELKSTISDYYKKIDSINFPERLDKLDKSISAINLGIQNLQTRLGDIERQIMSKIERIEKHQKNASIINIVFSIIILLAIFLLIYRSI